MQWQGAFPCCIAGQVFKPYLQQCKAISAYLNLDEHFSIFSGLMKVQSPLVPLGFNDI